MARRTRPHPVRTSTEVPRMVVSCLSHSSQRVSTTALRASSVPVVSQEERHLWRPGRGAAGWLGWEAEEATRVAGRGPAYPPWAPGQGTSPPPPHPRHQAAAEGWLGGSPPPGLVATCSTGHCPGQWRRSSPRLWCSAPARRRWRPAPGACCAP